MNIEFQNFKVQNGSTLSLAQQIKEFWVKYIQ
jgi:hypothetical protein